MDVIEEGTEGRQCGWCWFCYESAWSPELLLLERPFRYSSQKGACNPTHWSQLYLGVFIILLGRRVAMGHPVASSTASRLLAIPNSSVSNILRTLRASHSFKKHLYWAKYVTFMIEFPFLFSLSHCLFPTPNYWKNMTSNCYFTLSRIYSKSVCILS